MLDKIDFRTNDGTNSICKMTGMQRSTDQTGRMIDASTKIFEIKEP